MSKLFSWFKKDPKTAAEIESEKPVNDDAELAQGTDAESTVTSEKELVEEATSPSPEKQNGVSEHTREAKSVLHTSENLNAQPELSEQQTRVVQHNLQVADKQGPLNEAEIAPDSVISLALEDDAQDEQVTETVPASEQHKKEAEHTRAQPSLFARLKSSLAKTKANIGSGFSTLLLGKSIDDDLYEELETQLLLADVGISTTTKIIKELTLHAKRSELKDGEALSSMLQEQMQSILDPVSKPLDFSIAQDEQGQKHPFVILMVGVNGVGKTTTIGKLAKQFQAQGKSVMLAAGDTFRAAAVEQLQVWGERNDIPVVAQHTGADSASVIFDAIASAKAKNVDVLIADTAGRLQNKDNLIEELKKVVRVMKKLIPNAPHEIMLTLDASTGQNAVSQTRIFNQAVGISGINLTKLDGSAKGGVIFALADEFSIPVRYIGMGEGIDDLREFESKAFVDALFAE